MFDDPFEPDLEGLDLDEIHGLRLVDTVELTSVGIDVGTATSQVLFSRLVLKRMGAELSSRFVVVSREQLYLSPVHLTPYAPGRERIDDLALGTLVDDAYFAAGLKPGDVDTGAVILTGEAIRRDNARAIADLFAGERGNFVCATAGHHFEALLAAYGSGTVALSQERSFRLLNVDVGGGTTKLSVVEGGRVIETAALHLGGRLVATDEQGRILVLEPGGAAVAQAAGLSLELGRQASLADLEQVADWMADALLAAVRDAQPRPEVSDLFLTPRLKGPASYDGVVFSGGVGEYVYGKETASFGDLGQPFGRALGQRLTAGALPWPLLPAQECIRATVVGASQHSVQVSGNTIYASDTESLLPQRNLQVLRPDCDLSGDIHPEAIAQAIGRHFARFDLVEGESNVALVFQWEGDASFQRLNRFFDGLLGGIPRALTAGRPIVLVFDNDIGGIVGVTLREERQLSNDILSIDGITLRDFDFIDIGRILEPSGTVPVTIKSLIFQL